MILDLPREGTPRQRPRRIRRPRTKVFSSTDYIAGELFTHAQSCIWTVGGSDLAVALKKGMDPHADLAAMVLGVTYEEFIKRKKERRFSDARQASKPENFGKPGGMGDPKLVAQQRKQGPDTPCEHGPTMIETEGPNGTIVEVRGYKGLRFCILMGAADRCGEIMVQSWGRSGYEREIAPTCLACLECAARLGKIWKQKWRENPLYFDYVSECVDSGMLIKSEALDRWPHLKPYYSPNQRLKPGQIMQHVVGRLRGGLDFTSAANGFFQGLLSDVMKRAYWRATRECHDRTVRIPLQMYHNSVPSRFAGGPSPLLGSHIPGFLHDELLGEHFEDVASDCAWRISEIMAEEIMYLCPDVAWGYDGKPAAGAEPALMYNWNKAAAHVVHAGKVVPWTPDHSPKKCLDCIAWAARSTAG